MTHEAQVAEALNRIVDPCSATAGTPLGLVDMGIVESIDVQGAAVTIRILPTFPGCLYTAVFAGEIERRLGELEWVGVVDVSVRLDDVLWDEDRIAPAARERLRVDRDRRRRALRATQE